MSTSVLTASAPTTRQRRGPTVRVGLLFAAALAAWMLAPSLMALPGRTVGWQLNGFPGRESDTTPTRTTISVYVPSWPTDYPQGDDSWLDRGVIETPWTVTIALHTSSAFDTLPAQRGWFDTGGWVTVHVLAPIGGRMLFDGSGFPRHNHAGDRGLSGGIRQVTRSTCMPSCSSSELSASPCCGRSAA